MAETRLYKSKPKLLAQITGALLLAVLCPLIAGAVEGRPVTQYVAGWGGALIFGSGALFLLRDMLQDEPVLLLDDRGVSGPGLDNMAFVPWRTIDSVKVADRRKRGVLLTIDEERARPEDRAAMGVRLPARDRRGYLVAQIKVADLAINAEALARLLADGARSAERAR